MVERSWGRIRVREDQARLMFRLLYNERGRMVQERMNWKSDPTVTPGFNRVVALIDASRDELFRLAEEMGWDLREPRESDT